MKNWVSKALNLLAASLDPPKHELNELDWKAAAGNTALRANLAKRFASSMAISTNLSMI